MKKFLAILFSLFLFTSTCFSATNSYDQYGSKTGSYRKTSSGYNSYDKYGAKTGSFKTNSNGVTTSYDKYGQKTGSFKKDSSGRITKYDKYGRKVGSYKWLYWHLDKNNIPLGRIRSNQVLLC